MYNRIRSLAVLALVMAAPVAGAQQINRAATGLAAPAYTLDFEGQGAGTAATTQYTGQGVFFGARSFYTNSGYFAGSGGGDVAVNNFEDGNLTSAPLDIFFTQAVRGAAFQFITNSGTSTFTALLAGNVVSSFSGSTDTNGEVATEWYGFDNTIAFDQIQVQAGGVNNAYALDNLQVGVVATPEPASMTLVATGLIGMFGVARRRRNRVAV